MPTKTATSQAPDNGSEAVLHLPNASPDGRKIAKLPENHMFRYWVDPARVIMKGGKAYFNPVKVEIVPGVERVVDPSDPSTSDGLQTNRSGRTMVPMDFKVKAWGEDVEGYVRRISDRDARGKVIYHYHDVWTRYETIGTKRIAVFDADGFHDFRKRVAKHLMKSDPAQAIADGERARIQMMADYASASGNPAVRRLAEERLSNANEEAEATA